MPDNPAGPPLSAEELTYLCVYLNVHGMDSTRAKLLATIDSLTRRVQDLHTALAEVVGTIRSREAAEMECLFCGAGKPYADHPHFIRHDDGSMEECLPSQVIRLAEKILEAKP